MKSQMLKITGINSFNDTQEIDFSKILNNGIFGIFGDTGSGKSTIIDAITLALYGKIVRYPDKSKNGDFINLARNNAKVEFIFSIKDGKDEVYYEVIRQFKRNNKGEIKSDVIRLSVFKGTEKEILADKKKDVENKIKEIIGLGYEDFTKAVVLPQGKFSEFLMLENTDKIKMLQRIFNLEKYGEKLKNKINEKKAIKESEINNLKKEIEFYGDVSIEIIETEKIALEEKEDISKKIAENIENILNEEKYFENVINIKNEYNHYNNKINEFLSYKDTVLDFENRVNFIIEAEKIAPYILENKDIILENKNILDNLHILNKQFEDIENKYNYLEKEYNRYKNEKEEDKPKLDKIKQDLEQAIDIINEENETQKEITNIKSQLKDINENLEEYKNKIINIEKNKKVLVEEREEILLFNEKNKIDNKLKQDLENAKKIKEQENNLLKDQEDLKINIESYKEKLENNNLETEHIKKDMLDNKNIIKNIIITNVLSLENIIKENDNLIEEKSLKNNNLEKEIEELNIQIKIQENKEVLKDLAKSLTENNPCPLCGSTVHPNPIKIVLDNVLKALEKDKLNKEEAIKENVDCINSLKNKNNLLLKNIQDIKFIGSKYNIDFYDNIKKEYLLEPSEILKNIYKYEQYLTEYNKNLNEFNINNQNIANLKSEKETLLNENNKLLEDIKNKLNKYCEHIKTNNIEEKYEEILNLENIIYKNNERYLDINKIIEDIDNDNKKINDFILNIEKEKIALLTKSEEKENNVKIFKEKIKKLSYDKEPKTYIIEIENKIKDILEKEAKYKNLYEQILEQKNNIEKNINEYKVKININNENIKKKNEYINEYMENSCFNNENEALQSYKEKDKKDYYEDKIKSYKEKTEDFNINLKRLTKEFEKLGIDKNIELSFLNEKIQAIKNQKDFLLKEKDTIKDSITALKISISQKEKDFEKIEKTTKIIKKEEKELDILKELSDVNKGGKFVEYVANRQLKHIVFDASKRLFNMSQSKYSLELLDNSFVIKDNYNGGTIRSPRSLSGGEVFMASLSLALSLSSKIQLKNKSPLEIFFLDEGFGTLDNNTLDTVINTLEQLQADNVSVGIITHVEDIKNRVENKINVKATDNGSKISF